MVEQHAGVEKSIVASLRLIDVTPARHVVAVIQHTVCTVALGGYTLRVRYRLLISYPHREKGTEKVRRCLDKREPCISAHCHCVTGTVHSAAVAAGCFFVQLTELVHWHVGMQKAY